MTPRSGEPAAPPAGAALHLALRLGVGLAVAVVLAVAGALFFYAHPLADDFCHASDARRFGVFGCVRDYYLTLGGRWPGWTLSCSLFSVAGLFDGYRPALFAIAVFSLFAIGFLLTSILPLRGRWPLAASLTLLLWVLYWAGMPHPGQTIYWLEGAIQYTLSLSLSLILVACLFRMPEAPSRRRAVGIAALALFAALVAAFHELMAAVLLGVLVTGTGLALLWRDGRRAAWLAVTVAAGVGFASGLVAPGNEVRTAITASLVPEERLEQGLLAGLRMWIQVLDAPAGRASVGFAGTPLGWLLDPKLLGATLLFATAASVRSLRPAWLERAERPPLPLKWVVPVVGLGLLTAAFLAGGWAQGRILPYRSLNGLYLVFLLGWFATIFLHTRWNVSGDHPGLGLAWGAGAVLFGLGLLVSANVKFGIRDLVQARVVDFDRQMTRRQEAIDRSRARGETDLLVAPIEVWPDSYFHALDVTPDPGAWRNGCLTEFSEARSLRLASPAEAEGG